MNNFRGTKGKWIISKRGVFNVQTENENRMVATTGVYSDNHNTEKVDEENKANALLIASAPELLEALQSTLALINSTFKSNGWNCDEYQEVIKGREAIKKALGE